MTAGHRWHPGERSTTAQLLEALAPHAHVRVFVPSQDRNGRRLPSRGLRRRLEDDFVAIARGATTYPSLGTWRNGHGVLVRERVAVVETHLPASLSADEKAALLEALHALQDSAGQEAVAVTVNGRLYLLGEQVREGGGSGVVRELEATPAR